MPSASPMSQAAGSRQCILDGALTKRFQAGQAASGAVLSALLAREGFTGAHHVFAGRFGFFPMYQPDGYDLDAIADGLGQIFRGVELSFKPYPSGRPNHAMLDVALEIAHRLDLATADAGAGIAEVVITVNPQTYKDQLSPEAGKRRPSQVVEAQFSIPFLVAAALVRGRVGIGEVAGVDDPQVLALSDRIQGAVRADAAADLGADHRTACRWSHRLTGNDESFRLSAKTPQRRPTPGQIPRLRRPCGAAYCRRGRRARHTVHPAAGGGHRGDGIGPALRLMIYSLCLRNPRTEMTEVLVK